jgi:hypothetical protein
MTVEHDDRKRVAGPPAGVTVCVGTRKNGHACTQPAWDKKGLCRSCSSAVAGQRGQKVKATMKADREELARTAFDAYRGNPPAFAAHYNPFTLSDAWRGFLGALYGLPLDEAALAATQQVCGFAKPAPGGYGEGLVVAGRRSGKSAVIACLSVYVCAVEGEEHMKYLQPGQRGYVVVISRTQRQALEVYRYARGIVERNKELAALLDGEPLESQHGGELRFRNGVVLTIMPASKASIRGYTVLAAVLDEFAWVSTEEEAANADEEIASAMRYAMLKPDGAPRRRLMTISSPAAKAGIVYDTFQKYHGQSIAPVLVAHGPTWVWNPSIDRELLEEERKRDPKRYAREVLAEFVDAINAWIEGYAVDAAAAGRGPEPLPYSPAHAYVAGCDMAFKRDSAVLAIGHMEGHGEKDERFVVDLLRRWSPAPGAPLDSTAVVAAMANELKAYRLQRVLGDQFAVAPLKAEFDRHHVTLDELTATNRSKLDVYGGLRERFYGGRVSLPAHPTLLLEFRELQERLTKAGNIQIGAPNRVGAHDDCASATAWCFAAASGERAASFGSAEFQAPRHTFAEAAPTTGHSFSPAASYGDED